MSQRRKTKNIPQNKICGGRVGSIDSFARCLRFAARFVLGWPSEEGKFFLVHWTWGEGDFGIFSIYVFDKTNRTRGGEELRGEEKKNARCHICDMSCCWAGLGLFRLRLDSSHSIVAIASFSGPASAETASIDGRRNVLVGKSRISKWNHSKYTYA